MSRRVVWTAVILTCLLSLVAVASALFEKRVCCAATENGAVRDFRQFTAEQLDRDVRARVPLGVHERSLKDF